MQRFLPRVHVERLSIENIPEEHFVTSFPQTSFMAVTAYQNQEVNHRSNDKLYHRFKYHNITIMFA